MKKIFSLILAVMMIAAMAVIVSADETAPADPKEIVDAAFALEDGASLPYEATLTGPVTAIDTVYSSQYGNVSVVIKVEGSDGEKDLLCYRMKGDDAATVAVGDTITVTGTIKNYKGKIEFDAGCTFVTVSKGDYVAPTAPEDPKEIVDAAFALEDGASLPYEATLTGEIVKINTEWSEQYGNITVTITVEGTDGEKELMCYRLKGDGAAELAVGDTITVTGVIKNYKGTIEFDTGCMLTSVVKAETPDAGDAETPDAGDTDTPDEGGDETPDENAPQTGFATALLAVVAVISGGYIVTKKH